MIVCKLWRKEIIKDIYVLIIMIVFSVYSILINIEYDGAGTNPDHGRFHINQSI